MKKALVIILCFAMILSIVSLAACNNTETTNVSTETKAETTQAETTQAETTQVETTQTETTQVETTTTEETTQEETTTAYVEPEKPEKTSLRILAIGNSYSQDTTAHLYGIAKDLGYEDIVIVNLYYPGCPLELAKNFLTSRAYDYEYNDNGTWVKKGKTCTKDVIGTQDWDVITLQQKSGYSGDPNTYEPYLTDILAFLKENAPNAKIMWNMTWAYQNGSTESTFSKYGNDQMVMYNAIVNTVKTKVLVKDEIDDVIPVGTAVQNLRTSYLGDTLQRDSLHLTYDVGRYLAGLMWIKQISGLSIDHITWTPENFIINSREMKVMKEAVNNAYEHPYEITQSEDVAEITFDTIFDEYDIDLDKYNEVELDMKYYAYYNSIDQYGPATKESGYLASNFDQFACTQMFEKKDLPTGTLLVLLDGYQYRPEGWIELLKKNNSMTRPANVTARIVLVDDTWWGNWNYRAFNLAKRGNPALTEEEMKNLANVFKILIPKDLEADLPDVTGNKGVDVESIVTKAGYDYSKYTIMKYDVTFYAYYNSTANPVIVSKATGSTAANLSQFAATTKKFTKDDLPNGTLIVLVEGYQYRPEGWTGLNSKNSGTSRPSNVTVPVVEVDDAWWASWTYRAFNIAKKNNPALTAEEMAKLDSVLFFLIPNAD